ncbi:beta-1,3-galactosyltransferase 5-like [Bradysia coprophila]|uniref:beta-1,3-galactosyltransferase 5-like n=1 Tax=Bradysia coprophila TaxID=38358 RepID=UPI00187DA471|nr:beta-1,3-galactosyltransferase 5-like [Bradysia coprophila]
MGFLIPSSLKYVRCLSNQLVKWRVLFLLSLITLTFLTVIYLPILSLPPHRPKSKFVFMNKHLCVSSAADNENQRTAVIVVLSSRKNFYRRNLVRQTYGTVKNANNVRILTIIFVLANSNGQEDDEANNNKLKEEADRYGDVIMGDFVDAYRNLTLKTIMAYDWITSYCRQAQIVVKTDDDVLVNIFELTRQLDSFSPADMVSSNIWCKLHQNENTVNDTESRFYASPVDFPSGKFPDHCAGVGYITPFHVIERIVDDISRSFVGRVCTHEDVFMTAIVPTHINSNATFFSRWSEPIKLVDVKGDHWFNYAFENGRDDQDNFLRNFVKNTTMDADVENFHSLRRRSRNTKFFLFTHSGEFEVLYRRLWQIIKKTFSN